MIVNVFAACNGSAQENHQVFFCTDSELATFFCLLAKLSLIIVNVYSGKSNVKKRNSTAKLINVRGNSAYFDHSAVKSKDFEKKKFASSVITSVYVYYLITFYLYLSHTQSRLKEIADKHLLKKKREFVN